MLTFICKSPIHVSIDIIHDYLTLMHKIMVINPKGGSGKSTIATNLCSYFANSGKSVGVLDLDPQKSSAAWLNARTFDLIPIKPVTMVNNQIQDPGKLDYLIIDTPASIPVDKIPELFAQCSAAIIPILPSPIDIRAGGMFIYQLLMKHRITTDDKPICIVANRTRERSTSYKELLTFINTIKLPLITSIRESSNYLQCAQRGAGIFDYQTKRTEKDARDWLPLIEWLNTHTGATA